MGVDGDSLLVTPSNHSHFEVISLLNSIIDISCRPDSNSTDFNYNVPSKNSSSMEKENKISFFLNFKLKSDYIFSIWSYCVAFLLTEENWKNFFETQSIDYITPELQKKKCKYFLRYSGICLKSTPWDQKKKCWLSPFSGNKSKHLL